MRGESRNKLVVIFVVIFFASTFILPIVGGASSTSGGSYYNNQRYDSHYRGAHAVLYCPENGTKLSINQTFTIILAVFDFEENLNLPNGTKVELVKNGVTVRTFSKDDLYIMEMITDVPKNSTYIVSIVINTFELISVEYDVSLKAPAYPYSPYTPPPYIPPTTEREDIIKLEVLAAKIQEEMIRIQTIVITTIFVMIALVSSYVIKRRTMVVSGRNPVNFMIYMTTFAVFFFYLIYLYQWALHEGGTVVGNSTVITDVGVMYLFLTKMITGGLFSIAFCAVYGITWMFIKLDNLYCILCADPDTKENEVILVSIYPYFVDGEKRIGIAPQDRDALKRLFGEHIQLKRMTRTVVDEEGNVGEMEIPIPLDQGWRIWVEGYGYKCILADDIEWYMEDRTVQTMFKSDAATEEDIDSVDDRRQKMTIRERMWGKKKVLYCKLLIAGVYSNYEYFFNLNMMKELRDKVTALEAAQYPFRALMDTLANKKAVQFLRQKFRISPTDDLSQTVHDEVEEISRIAMSDSGHESHKYVIQRRQEEARAAASEKMQSRESKFQEL